VNVLVAAVSTRAAAESAARAGFSVTAIDAFADADQHPAVRALALGGRFSPAVAVTRAQEVRCDAVAYGANFENDPDEVTRLAAGRTLWGNPADVIRRVRDPMLVSQALRRGRFATLDVADDESRIPPFDELRASRACRGTNPESGAEWLVKRRASGGGHGVRRWRPGRPIPRSCYLQEFIDGTPCSIVFAAASGRSAPLGFSRQLIGDAAFGSDGFRYCGNILTAAADDEGVVETACRLAAVLSAEFDLVGVNGIDLIVRDGIPYAIEVNPRWCASMELVERAFGVSVFRAHAAACDEAVLPDFDLPRARRSASATGKAVVFARQDVTVGNTRAWLEDPDVRDVPFARTRIPAGRPICTVFADGDTAAACYSRLVARAARIYASL
jgi:predicted ATP-grasp superfamily ATP-dependent carboligase